MKFFTFDNSAMNRETEKIHILSLVFIGLVAFLNKICELFSILQSENQKNDFDLINLSIILIGLFSIFMKRTSIISQSTFVSLVILNICACSSHLLFDFLNWRKNESENETVTMYEYISWIVSACAILLSSMILFNRIRENRTCTSLVIFPDSNFPSISIILSSSINFFLICYRSGTNFKSELAWSSASIITGILLLYNRKLNEIVQSSTLILSGILIHPSLCQVWLNFGIVVTKFGATNHLSWIDTISLIISTINLLLITYLFLTTILNSKLKIGNKMIILEFRERAFIYFFFFLLVTTAFSLFSITIYNLFNHQLGSSLRAQEYGAILFPLMLAIFGLFSMVSAFNYIQLSVALGISLLTLNSTYPNFFRTMFFFTENYEQMPGLNYSTFNTSTVSLTYTESSTSSLEEFSNFICLLASYTFHIFLIFFSKSHQKSENLDNKKTERSILLLSIFHVISHLVFLIIGLKYCIQSTFHYNRTILYVLNFSFSAFNFGFFQMIISSNLFKFPILSLALLILSSINCLNIIIPMNFIAPEVEINLWAARQIVQLAALFVYFLTSFLIINNYGKHFKNSEDEKASEPFLS